MPGLPGSHGIYSLPADTITAIVNLDDPNTALATAAATLRPGTATWLIRGMTHTFGSTTLAVTFTSDDAYHRHSFVTRTLDWPANDDSTVPHIDFGSPAFTRRRHQLVLLLDNLFAVERSLTRDLADPALTRKPVHRAMLVALLHHWWDARIASGITPRAAMFMLSLLLPTETLTHASLPDLTDLTDDQHGEDDDDAYWFDPSTRVQVPIGLTLTPPPLTHAHA